MLCCFRGLGVRGCAHAEFTGQYMHRCVGYRRLFAENERIEECFFSLKRISTYCNKSSLLL
jgi:hypothetical protein